MRMFHCWLAALLILTGVPGRAATTNNVAAGKPTTQSSTNGSFTANLAVNSNYTDFTHTAAGVNTPATWEVNLTNSYASWI
jgi:hypothetical protein